MLFDHKVVCLISIHLQLRAIAIEIYVPYIDSPLNDINIKEFKANKLQMSFAFTTAQAIEVRNVEISRVIT